jgi:hypothetical protein
MDIWFNDIDNFEVKEFYYYPTAVVERIVEWDEGFHEGRPGLDEDVKDLFNDLLKETEKKLNKKHLMDNKIAMKIVYKPTRHEFFIGYKDWNWSLGLALNPYMTGKKIIVE